MFTTTDSVNDILTKADADARRLGLGHYLILIRRGSEIITVSDPSQLNPGDTYVAVTPDVKAG
jgi:hypothetical protein